MNLLDTLGDIGYGFVDASNAASQMYQNSDKAEQSRFLTDRKRQQLAADVNYDLFNAQAGASRAGLDFARNQNQLGASRVQDQLDYFDPQTRATVGRMVEDYGGADTPEFKRAYADYFAGRGMVQTANPIYKQAQQEMAAGQQVASVLRTIPGYESIQSVEMGEDGKVYGFVGQPNANGEYEIIELPQQALRQYAALMGNTRPLNYDLKVQQPIIQNQAAAKGQFPGQRQPAPQSQTPRPLTQNQLMSHIARLTKEGMEAGKTQDTAAIDALRRLRSFGIQLPPELMVLLPQTNDAYVGTPSFNPNAPNPGQRGQQFATSVQRQVPVQSNTPTSDYGYQVDQMGNPIYPSP